MLMILLAAASVTLYHHARQASLDHALIAAIEAGKSDRALRLLDEGASGVAHDPGARASLRDGISRLVARLRRGDAGSGEPEHMTALMLLCECAQPYTDSPKLPGMART